MVLVTAKLLGSLSYLSSSGGIYGLRMVRRLRASVDLIFSCRLVASFATYRFNILLLFSILEGYCSHMVVVDRSSTFSLPVDRDLVYIDSRSLLSIGHFTKSRYPQD